jgi:hypothetical protein
MACAQYISWAKRSIAFSHIISGVIITPILLSGHNIASILRSGDTVEGGNDFIQRPPTIPGGTQKSKFLHSKVGQAIRQTNVESQNRDCQKTSFLEADGKCPYTRLPKSRGMRRTDKYAAVTRDEGNAALRHGRWAFSDSLSGVLVGGGIQKEQVCVKVKEPRQTHRMTTRFRIPLDANRMCCFSARAFW